MSRPHKLLYVNYWSLREPLTSSATLPYLKLLENDPRVEKIELCTIERNSDHLLPVYLNIKKVEHFPFLPKHKESGLLFFKELFYELPKILSGRAKEQNTTMLYAKGSLAGGIAYLVYRRTGLPFVVESFEPHSTYMAECGVWKKWDPRYLFSRYLENQQTKHARYLIPVTRNQRNDMIAAGIPGQRIKVIPSATDLEGFKFDPVARSACRKELGIPETATVGTYVGKFGGLYLDEEAFHIFKTGFDHFSEFYVVILTPDKPERLRSSMAKVGIDLSHTRITTVHHSDVPKYLSASDFGFSTVKPAPVKRYQCPVKNGEYWANGLPIFMTDGVADDHLLLRRRIGGVVYKTDLSDLDQAYKWMKQILQDPEHREATRELAVRFKSMDIAREAYRTVFATSSDRPR